MKFGNNIGVTQEIGSNGQTIGYFLKLKQRYISKENVLRDMRILQNSKDMYNFIRMLKEHTDQPQHIQEMINAFLSEINR